jgi:uncharacterized membrane protein YfcA
LEYLIGFVIAVVIALTGVGAGTITAPILILVLHVPGGIAIGTALGYAVVVKLIISPVQIFRGQVNYKVFGFMLLGGGPGVLLGSILFRYVAVNTAALYWILGVIIVIASIMQLSSPYLRKNREAQENSKSRLGLLALVMFPIGAEVGLSSSGAGALGTLCLLSFTSLPATDIVGTDVLFGLCIAILGSGIHFAYGAYSAALLTKLVIGGVGGATLGCILAPRVPNKQLRFALACWLLFLGADFCYRAARL